MSTRILVFGRSIRESEDYIRACAGDGLFKREDARAVYRPEHFYGTRPDAVEVHLIGCYWEHPDADHVRHVVRVRGLTAKEVYDWR